MKDIPFLYFPILLIFYSCEKEDMNHCPPLTPIPTFMPLTIDNTYHGIKIDTVGNDTNLNFTDSTIYNTANQQNEFKKQITN